MKNRSAVLGLFVAFVLVIGCTSAQAQWGNWKKLADKAKKLEKKPDSKPADTDSSKSSDSASTNKPDSNNTNSDNSAKSGASSTTATVDGQPQMHDVKIDFVPGEKTVMFDDFSDWGDDEPPPHWKVRGDAVVMRSDGQRHEMFIPKSSTLTSPRFSVPQNFTFEIELPPNIEYQRSLDFKFQDAKDNNVATFHIFKGTDTSLESAAYVGENLGTPSTEYDSTKPVRVAYWFQNGRCRAYVNGVRALDVNDVQFAAPITHIVLDAEGPIGIDNIRIAESAPDFSQVIAATGKYVTHGIYFDNGSDKLKPESAPVLKMIASGLAKNPALKLQVAGYTDSVGNDAQNLELSKRRAQAVVTVLTSQFGVDASRLSSTGYGAANPIASNDTPDGRAQNRRVEFVKQ